MTTPKKPAKAPAAAGTKGTPTRAQAAPKPTRARARNWKPVFLKALRETRSATAAAARAGISRSKVYEHRQNDPVFAAEWASVDEAITDDLEKAAIARAVDGVEEPEFYQGKIVGTKVRYSDALLQFLLRGRRREVYGERTEITGAGGGPVAILALSDLARETGVAGELEEGKA